VPPNKPRSPPPTNAQVPGTDSLAGGGEDGAAPAVEGGAGGDGDIDLSQELLELVIEEATDPRSLA